MRLAINISGIEVRDGVLPAMLRQHVRDAGLSMSMLELELTESGLMFSDVVATQLLSDLREDGVRVSVDDFGTGYSSLSRLQRLPVDVLKIDKAFVDDIGAGAKQGALRARHRDDGSLARSDGGGRGCRDRSPARIPRTSWLRSVSGSSAQSAASASADGAVPERSARPSEGH